MHQGAGIGGGMSEFHRPHMRRFISLRISLLGVANSQGLSDLPNKN